MTISSYDQKLSVEDALLALYAPCRREARQLGVLLSCSCDIFGALIGLQQLEIFTSVPVFHKTSCLSWFQRVQSITFFVLVEAYVCLYWEEWPVFDDKFVYVNIVWFDVV